jgi:hypothetical protein
MLEFCAEQSCIRAAASLTAPNRAFARIGAKRLRMILLHGAIQQLLWNDNVCKNAEARFRAPDVYCGVTILESGRCMEYRPQTGGRPKLFRMTSFANVELQPLWNDILDKKGGVGPLWGGQKSKRNAAAFSAPDASGF